MPTLGERLKIAREKSGLTIKKSADLCQTRIEYLQRLENGQYDKLPPPVYTQGFLKKYIKLLCLDEEETLMEFQREYQTAVFLKEKEKGLRQIPLLRAPKVIITPKRISLFFVWLAVLAVAGYLAYQINFLFAPPKIILTYPTQDITVNQTVIKVEGISDPSAQLTINGKPVYIDQSGRFSKKISLNPGKNILEIKAQNRFGKKNEITRQVIVN